MNYSEHEHGKALSRLWRDMQQRRDAGRLDRPRAEAALERAYDVTDRSIIITINQRARADASASRS